MLAIFDLDGTIAHTEPLVREAYKRAHAPMPADAWGQHWSTWCDAEAHERKTRIYLKLLANHGVDMGPLGELYVKLATERKQIVGILTGASAQAAGAVIDALNLPAPQYLMTGRTFIQKKEYLRCHEAGIYFEDDPKVAEHLRRETKWLILEPRMWSFPQRV